MDAKIIVQQLTNSLRFFMSELDLVMGELELIDDQPARESFYPIEWQEGIKALKDAEEFLEYEDHI